jgi:hypothetical protein
MRGLDSAALRLKATGGLFLLLGLFEVIATEFLVEALHPTGGVHELLRTGEERVRRAGNLELDQGYSLPSCSMVSLVLIVERVKMRKSASASRKTTSRYSGWMSFFIVRHPRFTRPALGPPRD